MGGIMARRPKVIQGAVSDVGEVESHASGYRLRFRLNGSDTAGYRRLRKEIDAFRKELLTKQDATKAGVLPGGTLLSLNRIRQAEAAYQLLDNAKLTHPKDEKSAAVLVVAAQKLIEAEKRAGRRIQVEEAFRLFMDKQRGRGLPAPTLRDYQRLAGPFVTAHKSKQLATITSVETKAYIEKLKKGVARFKAYTYLHAFFNFCCGKHNPHIDGTKDNPWLPSIPLNFEKPEITTKKIVCYTTAEVATLLRRAHKHGGLGYLVFRLFSMARFDETGRFIAQGGGRWRKHPHIDLAGNKIFFDATVFRKRRKKNHRGRDIPIGRTFRSWIDFLIRKGETFAYDRWHDEYARRGVPEKFGRDDGYHNLLRHTGITMHIRRFKDPAKTADAAGTSVGVIMEHYHNPSITDTDAERFYALTPAKLGLR